MRPRRVPIGACPAPRRGGAGRSRRPVCGGRTVARLVALALLWALLGAPAAAGQAADGGIHHAGLVVRHGDGRTTYAYVPFAEEEISGLDLLARSGIPRVTVPFGGLGEGVCSLDGEGCGVAECRRRVCQGSRPDDPYWRYFRQEAPGRWRPLALGASATRVRDGDVDGWSWTGVEAGLPALTLAEVAAAAGAAEAAASTEPMVRTLLPPGRDASDRAADQGWPTYAGAAGVLVAIGGGACYGLRRQRRHHHHDHHPGAAA